MDTENKFPSSGAPNKDGQSVESSKNEEGQEAFGSEVASGVSENIEQDDGAIKEFEPIISPDHSMVQSVGKSSVPASEGEIVEQPVLQNPQEPVTDKNNAEAIDVAVNPSFVSDVVQPVEVSEPAVEKFPDTAPVTEISTEPKEEAKAFVGEVPEPAVHKDVETNLQPVVREVNADPAPQELTSSALQLDGQANESFSLGKENHEVAADVNGDGLLSPTVAGVMGAEVVRQAVKDADGSKKDNKKLDKPNNEKENVQKKSITRKESSEELNEQVKSVAKKKSWYSDRYQRVRVERNILFLLMVVVVVGMTGLVNTLGVLMAGKVFEPFVIEVEDKTGVVTQVSQKTLEKYTADESVIRYFVHKYLGARESYDANNYDFFYNQVVRYLSSQEVYRQFVQKLKGPDSPLKHGRRRTSEVSIKSMAFLDKIKHNVQVRFVVYDYLAPGNSLMGRRDYIATLKIGFVNMDLSQKGRYINPLGFQVIGYRLDDDNAQ